MSLFNVFRRIAVPTVLLAIVAGCGFRPLYAPPSEDVSGRGVYAFDEFRHVVVDSIPDRDGQYFRNKLVRLIQPSGRGGEAKYILKVVLDDSTENLSVQRSAVATRANLRVTGQFVLTELKEGAEPFSGTARSSSGYNLFQSEFQTLMAEKGARERALDDLAQQIRIRLAAYLTNPDRGSTTQ